jgi:hypothetical protein
MSVALILSVAETLSPLCTIAVSNGLYNRIKEFTTYEDIVYPQEEIITTVRLLQPTDVQNVVYLLESDILDRFSARYISKFVEKLQEETITVYETLQSLMAIHGGEVSIYVGGV